MPVFNITFGTPLHQKVLDACLARIRLSKEKMSARYAHFSDMEEEFISYIPDSENDKLRKINRKSQGLQTYTTIVVPYSYATLMAAHMYWTSVFLSRDPIHQFAGHHGEADRQVLALEALVNYQVGVGQMSVPYYIWLLDAGKYGLGVLGTYWAEEYNIISELVEEFPSYNGIPLITGKKETVRYTKRLNTYTGNRIYNIRPQDFLPDPRVPITRFQDGEFAGRRVDIGWNTVLKRSAEGLYYNMNNLKQMRNDSKTTREQGSSQIILPENTPFTQGGNDIKDTGTIEAHELCVELVPRDWELGTGSYPEKWVFTIAQERIIISAQPLGNYHNKFPFDIMEYEPDGYALFKRSLLEIIKPLNEVITWLVNSHFYNVRKSLNNQWVVDPSRVTMTDITSPNAGKVIRVKPSAYGQDVREMVHQLPVTDVTRSNIGDISMIEVLMQRVSGVADTVMGVNQQGGRRTAAEVRTSSGFSINRLKTVAEYMSALGFAPHSQKIVSNTLQYYKGEKVFKIAGPLADSENPYVNITPEFIAGSYGFIPVDGTLPVDRFAMMSLWNEILKSGAAYPGMLDSYNMGEIFAHIAQLGGLKALKSFRIQTMPNEQISNAVQRGNLIPMRGQSNGGQKGTGRSTGPTVSPVAAPEISGVGRVG